MDRTTPAPLPSYRQLSTARLRISSAVSIEFLYRDLDPSIPPRVDCIVMFAGPQLEQIATAFEEAVRLLCGNPGNRIDGQAVRSECVGGLYRLGRRVGVGRTYRYLRRKLHI